MCLIPLGAALAALIALGGCRGNDVSGTSDAEKLRTIEAMYEEYKQDFTDAPDVSVDRLLTMLDEGDVVIVDGRPDEERAVSMIPGAISIDELERDLDSHRTQRIVLYCTVGYRSGVQTVELRRRGLDAYNLRGSILAWLHAGQEVVDARGLTRRVHVYGRTWDLAPKGYEAVW